MSDLSDPAERVLDYLDLRLTYPSTDNTIAGIYDDKGSHVLAADDVRALVVEVRERRAAEERVRALVGSWKLEPRDFAASSLADVTLHNAAEGVVRALGGDQ